jgi:hypothetical protein
MDEASLIQIREIIDAAAESLRSDIAEARQHSGVLTEGLRQEFHLVNESLRADIADARRHAGVLTEGLKEDLQVIAESLRADVADARRHAGVLTEGLRHELQLVAEGFQLHLAHRHFEERAYIDDQFRETRALIQLLYGQIQERVERLER